MDVVWVDDVRTRWVLFCTGFQDEAGASIEETGRSTLRIDQRSRMGVWKGWRVSIEECCVGGECEERRGMQGSSHTCSMD